MTDNNIEQRESFVNSLVEAVNLDEWTEAYFPDLQELADTDAEQADAVMQVYDPLPYHWQRREVYDAFTDEVWAAIWSAVDEDQERSPLAWICAYEDDREVDTHEKFIDLMVIRALGIVAMDLLEAE